MAAQRFSNGPGRAVLIELYTSEGCSSCPPADRWLNDLRIKPGLWTEFVPVEFHVTYWDELGWKDLLASADFTARQRAYASDWGTTSVATPCFVRNGLQWRPLWGTPGGTPAQTGMLVLNLDDDGHCGVTFRPGPGARMAPDGHTVHLAVLGGGISDRISNGENKGRTLPHEFVVLGLADQDLVQRGVSTDETAVLALPKPIAADAVRRAVAAWVTKKGEMAPIQAAGGWLAAASAAE